MMRSPLAWVLILVGSLTTAAAADQPPDLSPPPNPQPLNLQNRIGDLDLVRDGDRLLVQHHGQTLTAEQYLTLIDVQQQRRDAGGPLFKLLNITTSLGIVWVGIGLLGQLLFTGRMVVQWLVSEKEKRSIVPPIFWHISLAGATMLLVYFVWRKDIVGVLGQSAGWAIYARNLFLLRQSRITAPSTGEAHDSNGENNERLAPGQ